MGESKKWGKQKMGERNFLDHGGLLINFWVRNIEKWPFGEKKRDKLDTFTRILQKLKKFSCIIIVREQATRGA